LEVTTRALVGRTDTGKISLPHVWRIEQISSMPKKKEPELDPKQQFKRFVETASK